MKRSFMLLMLWSICLTAIQAQYFGRNKTKYKKFDYQVHESPNFEVYHYLENENCLHHLIQQSEQWYHMHQEVLKDTFAQKNPIIFYNNHADFQQTNAISGAVGVGTGGVTEGFKRRVVMPIAMSNQQTNHVLGHELVHAFQYHMMTFGDSTNLKNITNIPLWMIEGLAEYMSIGRTDAHTAMWMRDAVLNDDVPSLKALSSGRYFPYRYGQAFWAFLTGVYGDNIIEPFFVATAKYGLDGAARKVLNTSQKNLSSMWQSGLKNYYKEVMTATRENTIGKKLLSGSNSGDINIAPALSPNGKYVMYLSEKNLFSIDLFLADARSGKILRQIASTTRDGHLDAFNFIESAGTWSPNSKRFALVAFKKGKNALIIKDIEKAKTTDEIFIPGVPAFSNPTWSPDGKEIVVSGLVNGQVDLYAYNIRTKRVRQLTNDRFSEAQPQWSADGKQLIFATDEWSMINGRTNGHWTFNLALMDVASGQTKVLDIFSTANNLNPVFDKDGNVLFLSNRDGFRNLYKYEIGTGKVFQMTDFMTGISGITEFAPAISSSPKRDRILYTHYQKGKYTIYAGKEQAFLQKEVDPKETDFTASVLPPVNPEVTSIVEVNLAKLDLRDKITEDQVAEKKYQPKFKLDYVGGGAGVGVAATGFGPLTGMAGGVDLLFSDIIGNNQLYAGISLNGEIYDFGGQLAYLNKKGRISWGAAISHTPYRFGGAFFNGQDTLQFSDGGEFVANEFVVQTRRLFQDRLDLFANFPLSQTKRFEAGASFSHYGYRYDQYSVYVDDLGRTITQTRREKIASPDGFNIFNVNAAFVGDNSYFGIAAPLQGHRYRFGVSQNFGDFHYTGVTVDARIYKYMDPIALAFRVLHYGRYGGNANNIGSIYNIAYPWFVRGYGWGNNNIVFENDLSPNDFIGNKMLVSNFEIRIPFTGPEKLSLIKSKFLFTDLNFFIDGGLAWNSFDEFSSDNGEGGSGGGIGGGTIEPVFSAGASVRVNLFGAIILEPYWAVPIQKNTNVVFGLNIVPGW